MLSIFINFAFVLIGAVVLFSILFIDNDSKPTLGSLRGSIFPYSSTSAPTPTPTAINRQLKGGTGCRSFYDESACNTNKDRRGNECHWCINHLSKQVCVAGDSQGYKFAPCNYWVCFNENEPKTNDLSSCERAWWSCYGSLDPLRSEQSNSHTRYTRKIIVDYVMIDKERWEVFRLYPSRSFKPAYIFAPSLGNIA